VILFKGVCFAGRDAWGEFEGQVGARYVEGGLHSLRCYCLALQVTAELLGVYLETKL
jgi:hypothetical protein